MKINTNALQNAVESLKTALDYASKDPSFDIYRDAAIQRFEYTYELAYKLMKRHLKAISSNPSKIDDLTFNDFIREALNIGIIDDFDAWIEFRKLRGSTSHTYDEETAKKVFASISNFFQKVKYLLSELKKRNAN